MIEEETNKGSMKKGKKRTEKESRKHSPSTRKVQKTSEAREKRKETSRVAGNNHKTLVNKAQRHNDQKLENDYKALTRHPPFLVWVSKPSTFS